MSDDHRSLDALERDIRQTREAMGDTLSSLRHRLSGHRMADTIKEQTMDRMSHSMNRSASSMGGMVRSNPVPFAMIGIGLGWLLLHQTGYDERITQSRALRSMRDSANRAGRYARESASSAAEGARHMAESATDRMGDALHSARDYMPGGSSSPGSERYYGSAGEATGPGMRERMGHMGHRARERMSRARHGFWDMVDDHPLVAGVMGLALGAAVGASLPASRSEDRWMGDYADDATERAKHIAEDAIDRGTRAARAGVRAARSELREDHDETGRSAERSETPGPAAATQPLG